MVALTAPGAEKITRKLIKGNLLDSLLKVLAGQFPLLENLLRGYLLLISAVTSIVKIQISASRRPQPMKLSECSSSEFVNGLVILKCLS